jgi:UDP-N-acetylenolpyruvoylglucosamine reductase
LQPIGATGFTCFSGLPPTLGSALWANAVAEKQIEMRMSVLHHLPFAFGSRAE